MMHGPGVRCQNPQQNLHLPSGAIEGEPLHANEPTAGQQINKQLVETARQQSLKVAS